MKSLIPFTLAAFLSFTHAEESTSMFNGKNLDGWKGSAKAWSVVGGELVGRASREPLTFTQDAPSNFELTLEYQATAPQGGLIYAGSYRFDLASGAVVDLKDGMVIASRGQQVLNGDSLEKRSITASLGDEEVLASSVKTDDWNQLRLIVKGKQSLQLINGKMSTEVLETGAVRRGDLALSVPQDTAGELRIRNLQLRPLKDGERKQILFLAGTRSHGAGSHEHKAGCQLLARCLNESGLDVTAGVVTESQWPEPWMGYDKPDAIVMYCDGNQRHLAIPHQAKIQALVDQGIGVACLHYAVEVDKGPLGDKFLEWIGAYFENGWSVNPHWEANFSKFPDHPICRNVKPFSIMDEWYYHMRFVPEAKNVTPILSTLPPVETLNRKGTRGTNPTVQAAVEAGEEQVMAWAYERPNNGGRGFGFTGGHFHRNWRQDDFRKLVLNALMWVAKGDIPEEGIASRTPTDRDLLLNQDYPNPKL